MIRVPARLVTIATFGQMMEAQIARATLAAHDIHSFVADEHLLTLNPHYVGAASGIRLQTSDIDALLAIEILNEPLERDEDDYDEAEDGPRCPHCDARYAYHERPAGSFLLGLLLFGIPFLFLKKRWHCRKCHEEWQAAPALEQKHGPYREPRASALARPARDDG